MIFVQEFTDPYIDRTKTAVQSVPRLLRRYGDGTRNTGTVYTPCTGYGAQPYKSLLCLTDKETEYHRLVSWDIPPAHILVTPWMQIH